ncbi:22.7 kDa class IV heat shock protein-like [Rhodamnia argentea]|uniref:22.7 kDa class IV heat shock protein-like n=1 Tax=Rhodamnia argentea TaxID=178133 RepID=A0A8B8NI97_9MYRT|nr:22.7 kDa class IV heat shock protein-like [Rhodamnia argentea]
MASIAARTRSKDHTVEEFKPSSEWVEDSNCHYLLVDLPDFKKDDIKIQTDSTDHITVSGERLVKDNKYIFFEETFKVPENLDILNTSGRIEDGILTVTVPKRATTVVEKEETVHHEQDSNKESHDEAHKPPESEARGRKPSGECRYSNEIIEKWGEERSIFSSAMKMLNRNRGVLITAALAFSLGVWVSCKLNLGGHEKALE